MEHCGGYSWWQQEARSGHVMTCQAPCGGQGRIRLMSRASPGSRQPALHGPEYKRCEQHSLGHQARQSRGGPRCAGCGRSCVSEGRARSGYCRAGSPTAGTAQSCWRCCHSASQNHIRLLAGITSSCIERHCSSAMQVAAGIRDGASAVAVGMFEKMKLTRGHTHLCASF